MAIVLQAPLDLFGILMQRSLYQVVSLYYLLLFLLSLIRKGLSIDGLAISSALDAQVNSQKYQNHTTLQVSGYPNH
jgi:hypothetical protein